MLSLKTNDTAHPQTTVTPPNGTLPGNTTTPTLQPTPHNSTVPGNTTTPIPPPTASAQTEVCATDAPVGKYIYKCVSLKYSRNHLAKFTCDFMVILLYSKARALIKLC